MKHLEIIKELKEKGFLIEKAFVSGNWVDSDDKIKIFNPANEELIGTIPNLNADIIIDAVKSADSAQQELKKTSKEFRAEILKKWFDKLIENKEDIAKIITLEAGKSLRESRAEVDYAAGYLSWFSEEAKKNHDYIIPSNDIFKERKVTYLPVGVTAAITPWNFPLAMITRKAGAAIAAGCSMIIKPSEYTPFSALLMCKLALDSGLPKDILQIVTGYPKEIGEVLLTSFAVRKLSFTGSTATGKMLMRGSSDSLKKLSMELGGNAPLIINEDANIETAITMILNGKFRNNGQSCTAVNRVLVSDKIFNVLHDELINIVNKIKVGDGFDEENFLGSVINEAALVRLLRIIENAVKQGAKIALGGNRIKDKGYFLEPTILTNVHNEMDIARNEIFGPIISLLKFESEEEAITIANDTDYGLAGYICGENKERNQKMAERLSFGMIGINDTRLSDAKIPFGGIKNSGFGREGGIEGIFEYLETKYVAEK
ncbi:MAG: NAD-dependent succinate-semialdehyde dehydrogenase [Sphingobacteriia bacterium]|nr:NAD-dependent succinate-semialdehyde dehydrogenase [Sphingobacteriia bacterium]